jgi:hypothetical protein
VTNQVQGPRRRRHQTPAELWARAEAEAKRRELEDTLAFQIKVMQLPLPEREYRFDPDRLWRLDFAWVPFKLAAEVEGLVPSWLSPQGGRHQRIAGYEGDIEKYNAAAAAGWKVLRFSSTHVVRGEAIRRLEDALRAAAGMGPGR